MPLPSEGKVECKSENHEGGDPWNYFLKRRMFGNDFREITSKNVFTGANTPCILLKVSYKTVKSAFR